MKSSRISISELCSKIPLETRLKVSIEMAMIKLITDLGYRENVMWTDDENDKLNIICNATSELVKDLLEETKKWEEDGKPN